MSTPPTGRAAAVIPRALGVAVVMIALGDLAGWWLRIPWLTSFAPGHSTMNPTTAVALVLLGLALAAASLPSLPHWLTPACATAAALVGALRVIGYVWGLDPGIDHLLTPPDGAGGIAAAGRVAPHTALGLIALGSALILVRRPAARAQLAVQVLLLIAFVGSLVSLTGHLYGTQWLAGAMALNTAIALLLVTAGVLWAYPERGIAALLVERSSAGLLVRWLLPAVILVPLVLGWLRLAGQRAGLYDTAGGTAVFVVSMIVVLTACVWWSARSLERAAADRGAAERALQQSEERYRLLFEKNPLPAWVFELASLRFLAVNDAAVRAYGYSRVELLAMTIADIRPPGDVAALRTAVERIAAGAAGGGLWRHRKKDGTIVDVEITSHPVAYAGRQAELVLARDVTQQRQAEEALRASEERRRLLVESVRDYAIYMLDPDGRVTTWNRGAQQLKGYAAEEIIGRHFSCFYPPEAIAAGVPQRALQTAIQTGRFEEENWRVRKDGSRFWADVVLTPVRDGGGALIGFAKVTRDLSERQRIEEALRTSEERFRTLSATANDAIVSADSRGHITYLNAAAERIFGYTLEETTGQPISILMPERFHEAHHAGLARYVATGDARVVGRTVELVGRHRDGREFPIELSLASWKRGSEVAFTGIMRDITDRKRAEETSRRYAAQLETANAELDAFAYSVSHDLRAPLRTLDGFSQSLIEDCADRLDAQGTDYLQRIRLASQRMAQLIDDLLNLSRITRSEMRLGPVDLSAAAREIAAGLRGTDPSRQVEFSIAPNLVVEADPGLMQLVLENLLGNAWKFTSKVPHARIALGTTPHDGRPAYFVRDNGAGFDMAYVAKLFGAFQRLHAAAEFPGTGIGLATVQRIIHRHGGRIWAEAQTGRGATFYFTLS